MLIDIADVVEAYVSMGFRYRRLDGRRHRFFRHPTLIVHMAVRGIGFDLGHLFLEARVHGIDEELSEALMAIEDLQLHPLAPPSSQSDTSHQPR